MRNKELNKRVLRFHRLSLPGQPRPMHIHTLYLIDDLVREIQMLEKKLSKPQEEQDEDD